MSKKGLNAKHDKLSLPRAVQSKRNMRYSQSFSVLKVGCAVLIVLIHQQVRYLSKVAIQTPPPQVISFLH